MNKPIDHFVLGIGCSPRPQGNSSVLLEKAMEGATAAGAQVKTVYLRDMKFSPCVGCNGCFAQGQCVVQDDMQDLYEDLLRADTIILSAPIFSMGICAQGKALIDRAQRFWATKHILKRDVLPPGKALPRRSMFISVAGSNLPKVFDGALQTAKYYFLMLDCPLDTTLLYSKIDELGDALRHPEILDEVYHKAYELVSQSS